MIAAPAPVDSGDDALLTLAEACRLLLGGRVTPASLRAEAGAGA
jgi:hypothetical protein